MSSHHFVRDGQEPHLLVEHYSAEVLTIIEGLLEWSPTLIVTEQCLEAFLTSGIKVDCIVATVKRKDYFIKNYEYLLPFQVIDQHELEIKLTGADANVIVNSEQHVYELYEAHRNTKLCFYTSQQKFFCPNQLVFEKWISAGQSLFIHNMGPTLTVHISAGENHKSYNLEQHQKTAFTANDDIIAKIDFSHTDILLSQPLN